MSQAARQIATARNVRIRSGTTTLTGDLELPTGAKAAVLFAHGRHSPRNQVVARAIHDTGLGTLLFDLLTPAEEALDSHTRHLRFDIGLLTRRLIDATSWLKGEFDHLRIGYFGTSIAAAAALVAAAELGTVVGAVVSRSARPDLAEDSLSLVKAPTLLIVGSLDSSVLELNRKAYAQLRCEKEISIVTDATHLFEERGALEQVADLAADWFQIHLSEHTHRENQNQGESSEQS
jgi:pimeloyl-ACP methyl ester carboxylesterase